MLSSGMSKKSFLNCLKLAYKNGASGYLAGRTIWLDAFKDYPNYNKITNSLSSEGVNYVKKLNALTKLNKKIIFFDDLITNDKIGENAIKYITIFNPINTFFSSSYCTNLQKLKSLKLIVLEMCFSWCVCSFYPSKVSRE